MTKALIAEGLRRSPISLFPTTYPLFLRVRLLGALYQQVGGNDVAVCVWQLGRDHAGVGGLPLCR